MLGTPLISLHAPSLFISLVGPGAECPGDGSISKGKKGEPSEGSRD